MAMRVRVMAVLTLSTGMLIAASPASSADASPTPSASPSPSPTPSPTSSLSPMEEHKLARELFNSQVSLRNQLRRDITREFMLALDTANSLAKAAMRSAKNAETKSTILAQRKNAVELAAAARDAAISAMGPPPVEPMKPSRDSKIAPVLKFKPPKPSRPSRPSPTPSS